ncbi:hypothetical protein JHD46_05370 [Sulfurimonas sp. SAG-AH-194-C20]|nr:hypothetical protein [Sulfurimonas sp. SAG-AH-194-C20]MDF1879069.1 hypothetical protein [Sulfurimonas sp. SAG-AH-194-C20]
MRKRNFKTLKTLGIASLYDITLMDIITKTSVIKTKNEWRATPINLAEKVDFVAIGKVIGFNGHMERIIVLLRQNPIFHDKYSGLFNRVVYCNGRWIYMTGQCKKNETGILKKLFKRLETRDV